MQVFFPTGKRVAPRPGKKQKGAGFPNRNGSRTKRKALRPCGAVCVCGGGPQAEKRWAENMQGGPRPIHATALSHWRRSWAGADTCKNGLNCGSFCMCFLAGSYARAGARRSARLGVCARVFLAPPPGQESFGLHCGIPRAPSYARKIPASGFQQGAPQEARSSSAALPVPCGIRPALTAPGGATVRPGGPQRLRRPARCPGIRPALTAPGGATVRPGGP